MVDIVNILATGGLGREVDLRQLSLDLDARKVDYDPEKFPGLIIRPHSTGTLILFSSGKYSITGISDTNGIRTVEDDLFDSLRELGIHLSGFERATIRNIVCTGDLDQEIDLSHLAVILGIANIEYEPEQNPFLVYRPDSENCVMTIASSGKAVVTGLRTKQQAEEEFSNLIDRLHFEND